MFLMLHYDNDNVTLTSTSLLLFGAELFEHFVTNVFIFNLMVHIIFVLLHKIYCCLYLEKGCLNYLLIFFYVQKEIHKLFVIYHK